MKEGDRVATVGRRTGNNKKKLPGWTGAVYVASSRRDGVLIWRRDGSFGPCMSGRHPPEWFIEALKKIAEHPWRDGVLHGDVVGWKFTKGGQSDG